jgi:dTMP kinase
LHSPQSGCFIALEGIDGSGKTTLAERLASELKAIGRACVVTREPGGTDIGEQIRALLLGRQSQCLSAEAEALLFAAARAQHVIEVIRPALARGAVVISDRFTDSSLAYQSGGRGLPRSLLASVQLLATGGLQPDLKLLFDLPVETALARRRAAHELTDRLDRETVDFYERVRSAYHELVDQEPARWRLIDASLAPEEVWAQVAQEINSSGLFDFPIDRNKHATSAEEVR